MHLHIEEELLQPKTVGDVVKAIISSKDPTIIVYINCVGGDYEAGLYIYEALRLSGKHVITHAVGQVASAAVLIYLAGEERYAHEYSSFLIHEITLVDDKDDKEEHRTRARDHQKSAEELENDNDVMFSLIAERTKLTKKRILKEVENASDGDWVFGFAQAKKFGIVHKMGFPI